MKKSFWKCYTFLFCEIQGKLNSVLILNIRILKNSLIPSGCVAVLKLASIPDILKSPHALIVIFCLLLSYLLKSFLVNSPTFQNEKSVYVNDTCLLQSILSSFLLNHYLLLSRTVRTQECFFFFLSKRVCGARGSSLSSCHGHFLSWSLPVVVTASCHQAVFPIFETIQSRGIWPADEWGVHCICKIPT